jgi:EAL domain-containing protein (putative c-di-GMP-specific phosphodiesterase class I)
MKQVAKWHQLNYNPGIVSINISIKQLQHASFIEVLERLLHDTKCKPEWIELEITESHIMKDPEEAIRILNRINSLGIKLAVDDFGTGYSSLSYLKRLPIKKLKIDQSFVKDLPDDEDDAAISRAVIALAKSLNLEIIAEGVENQKQQDFLIKNGCNNIQGFLYSEPISAQELEEKYLKLNR